MVPDLIALGGILPAAILLTVILFVPGLLAVLSFGVGWRAGISLAPGITLLLFTIATAIFGITGVRWNLMSAGLITLVASAPIWLVGRRFRRRILPPTTRWTVLALFTGIAVCAILTSLALLRGMGSLDTASHGWDPIFHANALEWIRDSGAATPWSVVPIYGGVTADYYPVGWHLIVSLMPGSLIEAANLSAFVIGALVWPLGLSFLASVVLPRHPIVWAITPVLAAAYISFPYAQLIRSGQWPNGLGTALVPACLAMIILILQRLAPGKGKARAARELVPLVAIGGAVAAGTAAAHPSSLFAVAVATLPFAIGMCGRWLLHRPSAPRQTAALLTGAAVTLGAVAISILTNSRVLAGLMNYRRAVRADLPDALLMALFDLPRFPALEQPVPAQFNLALGILTILGAVVALLRPPARGIAVSWLAFIALYVLAAGPENPFRWLTGVWYKDTQRLAPFIAMTGIILAALAVSLLSVALARLVLHAVSMFSRHKGNRAQAFVSAVAAISLIAVLYETSDNFRSFSRVSVTALNYATNDTPGVGVLSTGEQAFIERTGKTLPTDAVVIGDPFNGEPLFYALSGRRVVYTQLGAATGSSEAKELLRTGFNRIHSDPSICAAVKDVGATHFYEDQPGGSHGGGSLEKWPGFYNVDTRKGFTIVAEEGGRALHEITACS